MATVGQRGWVIDTFQLPKLGGGHGVHLLLSTTFKQSLINGLVVAFFSCGMFLAGHKTVLVIERSEDTQRARTLHLGSKGAGPVCVYRQDRQRRQRCAMESEE